MAKIALGHCATCRRRVICGITRGCCSGCYNYWNKLVKSGIITWEELERRGKCYPIKDSAAILTEWHRNNWHKRRGLIRRQHHAQ